MFNKITYSNFLYLALVSMLNTGFLNSQNLVPNPGFESLDSCIYNSQSGLDDDFNRFNKQIKYWYSLVKGSNIPGSAGQYQPNLISWNNYQTCPSDNFTNLPGYWDFSEEERSQNNIMCGFYLAQIYINLLNQNTFPIYREGIAVKLKEPLIQNKNYCVSLDARMSSQGTFLFDGTYVHNPTAISHLGITFSSDSLSLPLSQLIQTPYTPLYSEDKNFISDTSRWTRIGNIYQAQGGEQYIGLTNFEPDDTLMFQFLNKRYSEPLTQEQIDYYINVMGYLPQNIIRYGGLSYYFFDNVSIVPLEPIVAAISSEQVTRGGNVILSTSENCEQPQWFAGDTLNAIGTGYSLTVTPEQNTSYILKAKNCFEWMYDTVTVKVNEIPQLPDVLDVVNTLSSESFTIRYHSNERPVPIDVFLFDAAGRIVKSFRINETTEVSIRELASGVYFCRIQAGGYVGFTTKILRP